MQREDTVSLDHAGRVLHAVFVGSPSVYEAYSEFERPTRTFHDANALIRHIEVERSGGKNYFDLTVHYPETEGYVQTKRIQLDPTKCRGATWREKTEGWGLINVQFTYQTEGNVKCSVGANSEKRAIAWSETLAYLHEPALWKWGFVEKQTRRLIRKLRSAA